MEYQINDKPQWFFMTFPEGYKKVVGHEIKIGKYRFGAIALNDPIHGMIVSITEATSGSKLDYFPVNDLMHNLSATKEGYVSTLTLVADFAKRMIDFVGEEKLDKALEENRKKSIEKLGPMPEIDENDEVDEKTLFESLW